MHTKYHLVYGIAILFLVLSEVWLYREFQNTCDLVKGKNAELHKQRSALDVTNTSVTLLAHSMATSHQYENIPIPDILIETESNRKYHLSDLLLKDKPKIVVFFSSQNCESCVSSIFSNLENIGQDINEEDLVVVGEFDNRRAVKAYVDRRKIRFPVYYKSSDQPIRILETEGVPFVCMMTSNLIAHDVAIPIKEVPLFTRLYLRTMKEKYQ